MKIVLIISSFLLISSCSIQSNQYNFLKNLVTNSEDISSPKKNWSLILEDEIIDLFAINYQDQIIFADEKINLFYNDNQVYKITGLFPDAASIDIVKYANSLEYIVNNESLSIDICESLTILDKKNQKLHTIKCYHEFTETAYYNQITMNSDGFVIGLKFKIRPNYPVIELKLKKNVN